MTKLMLTAEVSKNLALRGMAVRLFDHAAFKDGEVELDFAGVEFMGRAFAHEYLRLRSRCPHVITEVNVPDSVEMMLQIVRNTKPKAGRLTRKELLEEPIPLMIEA